MTAALISGLAVALAPTLLTAVLGHMAGLPRRTCRLLWIAADLIGVTAGVLMLPGDPVFGVVCAGVWTFCLVSDIRRLRRDDDDDDRPRRRRKVRRPSLSGLVLPGFLQPARGAA